MSMLDALIQEMAGLGPAQVREFSRRLIEEADRIELERLTADNVGACPSWCDGGQGRSRHEWHLTAATDRTVAVRDHHGAPARGKVREQFEYLSDGRHWYSETAILPTREYAITGVTR